MGHFNRGRRNKRGRGGGSRANSARTNNNSPPSVKGAGAGGSPNKTLITKRNCDARTWPADMMAWKVFLASTISSLAFEPRAIKQVEEDALSDDEAYILFERSVREGKQAPPSLDFKTVPSERGWALLKVRSAKQLVAHLFNSDDEIGPIENELNTPSVLKQDELENLDDTTDERSYETALEILTQRQQRVQVCNVELVRAYA